VRYGIDIVDTDRVNLGRLDMNLLVSLDALLQERSVTRAADRMGLGQPAVSHALARLRRFFGDELLTRVGNRYELTPLGVQLRERARMAVTSFERVFTPRLEFEPATADREFSLRVSDYGETVLAPAVADFLAREAPRARLRLIANTAAPVDQSDPSLLTTDLVVMPRGFITDLRSRDLYRDEWVCLLGTANAAVGDALTVEHLRDLPWVVTFHSSVGFSYSMAALRQFGVEPTVRVITEHFATVPAHVAGSDRIGLLQRRLVELLPQRDDVRVLPCPFPAGSLTVAMWWHPVHDVDTAHLWFRDVVARAARAVIGGA
jgi:DNA-binding transcriptional LysR family regulator